MTRERDGVRMSPTRRTLLRASAVGLLGAFAGCAGDRGDAEATSFEASGTEATTATPAHGTATKTTRATATTPAAEARAVAFPHRSSVLDSGVRTVDARYHARVFDDGSAARALDASNARGEIDGRHLDYVERFVAETDLESSALFVVQAEVPSSEYGLSFDFVDRDAAPPQVVARVRRTDRSERGGESESSESRTVASTLLVRVPAAMASRCIATVVDFAGWHRKGHLQSIRTFAPPSETLLESVRVALGGRWDGLASPGGALVTTPAGARQFASENAAFSSFVHETTFERAYLLAVRTSVDSGDYLWPQSVERVGSRVAAKLRLQAYSTGVNSADDVLTLVRLFDASPPTEGAVAIRRYAANPGESPTEPTTLRVSATPDDWSRSGSFGTTPNDLERQSKLSEWIS